MAEKHANDLTRKRKNWNKVEELRIGPSDLEMVERIKIARSYGDLSNSGMKRQKMNKLCGRSNL